MVFCIGYNYTGLGLCTLHSYNRRRVEVVSFCMQVLCWVVVLPGMWVVGDSFYNSGGQYVPMNRQHLDESRDTYVEDVWEICSFVLFCGGNSVYVMVSLTLVLARVMEKKKNRQWEWVPRKKIEYCGDMISPGFRGLGLFHYQLHTVAMAVNVAALYSGADVYLSSFMVIITFLQCILSYLYSTDIAICHCCCQCFSIFLIRRHPRGGEDPLLSLKKSWLYEEWRVGTEERELVQEPGRRKEQGLELQTAEGSMGSYVNYLYLTSGIELEQQQRGVENENFENTA